MDVVRPRALDASKRLTDDIDFRTSDFQFAELAGDTQLQLPDLIDDVERLLGEANADGTAIVR